MAAGTPVGSDMRERPGTAKRRTLRALVSRHRELTAVLAIGALLRVAVEVAYWPALFYSDSWAYLKGAYTGFPAGFEPARPSGYPAILRLMMLPARELGIVTVIQHVAGLVTAVVTYALAVSRGVAKPWAALLAGLLLVDAWTLAVEQRLLSETFFALTLVLVAWLAVESGRGWWVIAAAGLLLGSAATLRGAALFPVPVFVAYIAWRTRSVRGPALAIGAVAVPLLLYGAAHKVVVGNFGLTESNGWFLYGRVAEFADCGRADVPSDARFLCQASDHPDRERGVAWYLWNPNSPVRTQLGTMGDPGTDQLLGDFALAVIRAQPGDYVRVVAADVGRFFTPGETSLGGSDDAIALPARPGEGFRDDPEVRASLAPGYEPPARFPASLLNDYATVVHLPRPLLGLAAVLALLATVAGIVRPRRMPHHKETFLLAGMGLALLIGSAATSEFVLRYLLPAAPLLLAAGAIAAADLTRARRPARAAAR